MRTILWFCYFWISLILLVPEMLYAIYLHRHGKLARRDAFVGKIVTFWMRSLLKLAGVTVHVTGQENIPSQVPCVFVCNHQGYFDIPILLCYLDGPHGFIAKMQLRYFPFIRIWMRLFGCVFIDRDHPRESMKALDQAIQNLRDGYSMTIFPEGTRSRGDEVGEFKSGAFRIAYKTGAPIVPLCIDGSYKAMEGNGMWIKPAHVNLHILPPVQTSNLSKEQLKTLEEEIRQQIIHSK